MSLTASLQHLESWEARCRYVASLYCKLGTLVAVGKALGMSRERVRQLMVLGHREGWCQYQPSNKQRTCNAVAVLPAAIQEARSEKHLSALCGLGKDTGRTFFAKIGLRKADLRAMFRKNNSQFHLTRLLEIAQRLGVADTLDTTIIQADREGKAAYNSALRHFGCMKEIRKCAGISIVTNDRRWAV